MNDLATLGLMVDSRQVVKGAEDLDKLAKASERAEAAAEKVSKSTQKTSESIKDQKDELSKLLNQIDPTTRALEKLDAQERKLAQFRRSGQLDTDTFKDYQTKIDAARNSLGAANDALQRTGNTAKQTANALRGVPAQFTDIVVSLQGGQQPLQVLLQQGGQLKDMFGGVGPAARALGGYVAGLVNPFTAAAAAAAALGVAYYQGSGEADAYSKALVLTGNAAGTTSGQLQIMADRIGSTVGTTHQAADVLAQLAGTGKIASSNLEEVGRSVLSFSKATGTAIEDVVSQFTKLSADPAKASAELNKELHYLTASTYAQIKALQDQGNATAAQSLAEQTLAKAFDERAKALTDRLGYIESGWRKVKGIASEAWDAMLNVGREDTLQKQIAQIEKDLSAPSSTSYVDSLITGRQVMDEKRKADLQLQLSFLKQQLSTEESIAKANQQKNEHTEKQISAQQRLDSQLKETASNQQKLADKLKQIDTDAALNPGKYTEAQIKQLKDAAAAQYADRDAINAANKARREAEVAAKRQAEAEQRGSGCLASSAGRTESP